MGRKQEKQGGEVQAEKAGRARGGAEGKGAEDEKEDLVQLGVPARTGQASWP